MEGVKRLLPDQFDPDPALQAALDRLTTYYPKAIDLGLERTFRLLEDLGNPHLHMPPIFHVGGTNGKGSTLAYIRSIAESAGLSCHAMTSPHLVRFNERFVVAGRELENQQLLQLIEEVEDINAGRPTTSFEIMTAAGFLAFTRTTADLTLLEVGMGGRFDATNVIKETLATIITVISRDHTKFLGTELPAIALEKAGIIKENCPVIIGPQTAEGLCDGVMNVFEDTAAQKNAPLYRHGHEWSFDILSDGFMLHTPTNMYHLPPPNLLGTHQYGNAATASMALLTALPALKKPIPLAAFETGLQHAHWLGRLQKLQQGPLVNAAHSIWDIWIDGGHNDTGGQVLAQQAKNWAAQDGKELHIILGMLGTKSPLDFVAPLAPYAKSIQTLTIPDQPLSFQAGELLKSLGSLQLTNIHTANSPLRAIEYITANYPAGGRILITGSLYLMGHILTQHT